MSARNDGQWFVELCKQLREEGDKHPEPDVCHSFQEYRWQLDNGFGGHAPRAGEDTFSEGR